MPNVVTVGTSFSLPEAAGVIADALTFFKVRVILIRWYTGSVFFYFISLSWVFKRMKQWFICSNEQSFCYLQAGSIFPLNVKYSYLLPYVTSQFQNTWTEKICYILFLLPIISNIYCLHTGFSTINWSIHLSK